MLLTLFLSLFLAGLVFGALHDVASMTIPNWLSLAFIGLFPLAALTLNVPWSLIGWHYAVGALALCLCIGLFAVGVFGGGDAKLIPAVLVWVGPDGALTFFFGLALAGGLLAGLILLIRRCVPAAAIPGFLHRSVVEGPGIPYAVAIAAGGIMAIPASPFLSALQIAANFNPLTMP